MKFAKIKLTRLTTDGPCPIKKRGELELLWNWALQDTLFVITENRPGGAFSTVGHTLKFDEHESDLFYLDDEILFVPNPIMPEHTMQIDVYRVQVED